MAGGSKAVLNQLERVELQFLKSLLGVPQTTSSKLVYAEFGRLPVQHIWLRQSLKYLDRLMQLDDGRLCKSAFLVDIQHGLGWYSGLGNQLRAEGIRVPRRLQDVDAQILLRESKDAVILKGMTASHDNNLEEAYFSFKTEFRCEPYISQAKNRHLRKVIANFRVGAHWLRVRTGRYRGIPYHGRLCPTCRCVDNEMHAIFHCRIYSQQRQLFPDLFSHTGPQTLRAFLASNPPHRLALFLTACKSQAELGMDRTLMEDRYPAHYATLDLSTEFDFPARDFYDSEDDSDMGGNL